VKALARGQLQSRFFHPFFNSPPRYPFSALVKGYSCHKASLSRFLLRDSAIAKFGGIVTESVAGRTPTISSPLLWLVARPRTGASHVVLGIGCIAGEPFYQVLRMKIVYLLTKRIHESSSLRISERTWEEVHDEDVVGQARSDIFCHCLCTTNFIPSSIQLGFYSRRSQHCP
jgi:hypothetical protein